MNDPHKEGLYRWQKINKPKVQSRSHRVISSNEIQDWIKKVEEVSDYATDAAFGLPTAHSGRHRGKAAAQARAGHARDQENAYSEAQDLLNQWVNDKLRFDEEDGLDDLEVWRRARQSRLDRKEAEGQKSVRERDTDRINDSTDFSVERLTQLALEEDVDEAAIYQRVKRSALGHSDPYSNLYELEESEAVDHVMQNMMGKDIVHDRMRKDLGLDSEPRRDPRTKMELRHKMVKENREKRQKEEDRRREEMRMKKEARLKAQQMILREQKDRETRARKEDQELKKEMAKIRKDMHEERQRKEEEIKRERERKEEMDRMAREELERQKKEEEKEMVLSHRLEMDRRKEAMVKRELIQARIGAKHFQCLHRHLTAWYDLVLSKRLLMGKVKAMYDWKLMLRVWGAWRSHVRGRRLEMETEIHERNVIDTERKKLAAHRHYTRGLLQRCLRAWADVTQASIEKRELEEEQTRTRNKMASLLQAVADGKLSSTGNTSGGKGKGHESSRSTTESSASSQWAETDRSQSASRNVTRNNVPQRPNSAHSKTDANYQTEKGIRPSSVGGVSQGKPLPTEAWQVTKSHLKLTPEEIGSLGQGEITEDSSDQRTHSDLEIRKRFGTQPWMNRQFVVNNLEHRYNAQQQALKEQQAQIREQKRLIEDLQFAQRQAALKQQLLHGADAPTDMPESPFPEVVAPPEGSQIPREDGDNGKHDDGDLNVCLATTPSKSKPALKRIGQPETARSGQTTDRSAISSVTGVTSMTSSTVPTPSRRHLQMLKNMEERSAQRARQKAEREERRRLQEEQKTAELERQEEERLREIEEEKRSRAEAYRNKKRLEKQKEEEKRRQQVLLEEQTRRADEHYARSILKYRGLLPFKKLISLSKRNWVKAIKHRDRHILRECLRSWKRVTDAQLDSKNAEADNLYRHLLTRKCFRNWRHYKYHMHFLERRAERHFQENLRSKFFTAWVTWVGQEREKTLQTLAMARQHYIRCLVRRTFLGWRHLPERQKREEERQKRKVELRKKVVELIPDFESAQSLHVQDSYD